MSNRFYKHVSINKDIKQDFPFLNKHVRINVLCNISYGGERMLQLMDVSPITVMAICHPTLLPKGIKGSSVLAKQQAIEMVMEGAQLKEINRRLGLPNTLKNLPFSVVVQAIKLTGVFDFHSVHEYFLFATEEMTDYWFNELPFDIDYALSSSWRPKRRKLEYPAKTNEIWIWAIKNSPDRADIPLIAEWAGSFEGWNPDIGAKKAVYLAKEHQYQKGYQKVVFPPADTKSLGGGLILQHIGDTGELLSESAAMHHCIMDYHDDIAAGRCTAYSLRNKGARVATVLIDSKGVVEAHGLCNKQVPKKYTDVLRSCK